jgi:hypothetical protein
MSSITAPSRSESGKSHVYLAFATVTPGPGGAAPFAPADRGGDRRQARGTAGAARLGLLPGSMIRRSRSGTRCRRLDAGRSGRDRLGGAAFHQGLRSLESALSMRYV